MGWFTLFLLWCERLFYSSPNFITKRLPFVANFWDQQQWRPSHLWNLLVKRRTHESVFTREWLLQSNKSTRGVSISPEIFGKNLFRLIWWWNYNSFICTRNLAFISQKLLTLWSKYNINLVCVCKFKEAVNESRKKP